MGLQIWRGALLLADYILSHPSLFEKKNILELGSGVGLTSIVASLVANEIICTGANDISCFFLPLPPSLPSLPFTCKKKHTN